MKRICGGGGVDEEEKEEEEEVGKVKIEETEMVLVGWV